MLPKKNRADRKDIDSIFKGGKVLNFPVLTFKYKLNDAEAAPKISFIAPKSVAKLAVKRNKLRRLGYNALKSHIKQAHSSLPSGIIGAFIFKKEEKDLSLIQDEIRKILSKIN